jgi:hypothetical protein
MNLGNQSFVGHGSAHGRGKRIRGYGVVFLPCRFHGLGDYPVYGNVFFCGIFGSSTVKAGLMQQDQCDQDTNDYADVQAQEIQCKKTFIFFDAAPSGFEIISKHGDSFMASEVTKYAKQVRFCKSGVWEGNRDWICSVTIQMVYAWGLAYKGNLISKIFGHSLPVI